MSEFEHIVLARVLLAEYQSYREERVILEAWSLLERLLKAAEAGKRMGSVLEILVTQALVYKVQGSTAQAFESLERALTLGKPEGYIRIFVDEGDSSQYFKNNTPKQYLSIYPIIPYYR